MLETYPVLPLLAQDADSSNAPAPPPSADVAPPPAGSESQPLGSPGSTAPGATGNTAERPPSLFDGGLMFILLGFMVLMIVFSISSGRKEKKRKQELLASLSKGQKVQTAGGVLGTVTDVRDHEVVVKVDENSNTRIRFAKSAIAAVVDEK